MNGHKETAGGERGEGPVWLGFGGSVKLNTEQVGLDRSAKLIPGFAGLDGSPNKLYDPGLGSMNFPKVNDGKAPGLVLIALVVGDVVSI